MLPAVPRTPAPPAIPVTRPLPNPIAPPTRPAANFPNPLPLAEPAILVPSAWSINLGKIPTILYPATKTTIQIRPLVITFSVIKSGLPKKLVSLSGSINAPTKVVTINTIAILVIASKNTDIYVLQKVLNVGEDIPLSIIVIIARGANIWRIIILNILTPISIETTAILYIK